MLLPLLMNLSMFGPAPEPSPVVIAPPAVVQFSQITDLKRQPVWSEPITEYHTQRILERDVRRDLNLQAQREDEEILAILTAWYDAG